MSAFTHEKRSTLTKLDYAKFFASRGGKCEECKRIIPSGRKWRRDHKIPLSHGGTDDDKNIQLLCDLCDALKTPNDISRAAKGKRQNANHFVPNKYRGKTFCRPLGMKYDWRMRRYRREET